MVQRVNEFPVALTESQMQAVGHVCGHWANAENLLEHFIWSLIPTDGDEGRAITTHIQNLPRLDIIRGLATLNKPQMFAEIDDLLKRFDALRLRRNTVVHNQWSGEAREIALGYKFSARGGKLSLNRTAWSAVEIEQVATDIEAWTVDTANFISSNLGWPKYRDPAPEYRKKPAPKST